MTSIFAAQRSASSSSFREANLAPDRVANIDAMVTDLLAALPPGQLTAIAPFVTTPSEHEKVTLKNGSLAELIEVQAAMVRLELMALISHDTLVSLVKKIRDPSFKMSDWEKINAEVWRCGETYDLPLLKSWRFKAGVNSFIEGLTLSCLFNPPKDSTVSLRERVRSQERLGFRFDRLIVDIIESGIEIEARQFLFVNPIA